MSKYNYTATKASQKSNGDQSLMSTFALEANQNAKEGLGTLDHPLQTRSTLDDAIKISKALNAAILHICPNCKLTIKECLESGDKIIASK